MPHDFRSQLSRNLRHAALVVMLLGSESERTAGVWIAVNSERSGVLELLASLASDPALSVRSAVVQGLAVLASRSSTNSAAAVLLLDRLLAAPGTKLGLAASALFSDELPMEDFRPLLSRLCDHPSAVVRWRARDALEKR